MESDQTTNGQVESQNEEQVSQKQDPVRVKDFNFVRSGVDDGFYFGAEIVNESNEGYAGSYLVINNTFKIPLPYVMPKSTVPVAFDSRDLGAEFGAENAKIIIGALNKIGDKSQVHLAVELGEECYEFPFSANLELEVKASDAITRTLTYTIKNNNQDEIRGGVLDLIFYNQGQIVAGLRTPIETMMTGRTHYVNVAIPKELIFTEVTPSIVVPKSDHLTFLGYVTDIKNQKWIIHENQDEPLKEKEVFEDLTGELAQAKKDSEKTLHDVQKMHVHHTPLILLRNILMAILSFFPATWHLVRDLARGIREHAPIWLIVTVWLIMTAVAWINGWDINLAICISVAPLLIFVAMVAVALIPNYIFHLVKKTNFQPFDAKATQKSKEHMLEQAQKNVNEADKLSGEYDIEAAKRVVEERNALIEQENEQIKAENVERGKNRERAEARMKALEQKFPQYAKMYEALDGDELAMVETSPSYQRYDDADIFMELDKIEAKKAEEQRHQEEEARNQRVIDEVKRQGDLTREHQAQVEAAYEAELSSVRAETAAQVDMARREAAISSAEASRAAEASAKKIARAVKDASWRAAADAATRNGYLASINGYARGIYYNNW
ncbi:hypothetical protein IJG04_00545 [Candidatus Saccharibacteria bacterium]|nr:hypothetical protein [Candidatus Saccharibacteria bacterium]